MTAPTLVTCLTPPGSGAVATVALQGVEAWELLRTLFEPRRGASLPEHPEPGRMWLGRIGGEVKDDAVLAVPAAREIRNPKSEIRNEPPPLPFGVGASDFGFLLHCHGGCEVVQLLLDLFAEHGARVVDSDEWVGASDEDPLRAEAAEALARCPTVRTASILLDQYHGALRRAWSELEAGRVALDLAREQAAVEELLRYEDVGRHLTKPWRVVLAGPPNVGKSSLLNALAGFQRSVVAATPGTTRDVVTLTTAFDGWPVELTDTAGVRAGAEQLEGMGIARTWSALGDADLCLWILDATTPTAWPPDELLALPRIPRLVVNKIDLVEKAVGQAGAWERLERVPGVVRVSARTGAGLDELAVAIARWLVPDPPSPGAAVPFSEKQIATLRWLGRE